MITVYEEVQRIHFTREGRESRERKPGLWPWNMTSLSWSGI